MTRWIAGLDGCRGAWAAVLLDLDAQENHLALRLPSVVDLIDGPNSPVMIGIDVPIGLPDRVTAGGRTADRAAQAYLGKGRSSVFSVPPRAAIYAADYPSAKELSRANSEPPFAPSIQCWNITRYIREVDGLLRARPGLAERLREVHPEVAFRKLNGGAALYAGKKGPDRARGLAERQRLLVESGLPPALVRSSPPPGIGLDDHLDAMAALVVARDLVEGRATSLPDPPGTDEHGLPIAIWIPASCCELAGGSENPC